MSQFLVSDLASFGLTAAPVQSTAMAYIVVPHASPAACAAIVLVSFAMGCLSPGRLRTLLMLIVWLAPVGLLLWLAVDGSGDGDFEIGSWTFFLLTVPMVAALWSTLTLLPILLAARLRQNLKHS